MLTSCGPSYGYFVNPGKTWLIVMPHWEHEHDAKELFSGTGIGITSKGKRHPGAALESYITEQVKAWISTILQLSQVVKNQSHAAYSAFLHGVSWVICCTIPDIYTHFSSHLRMQSGSISSPWSQDVTASVHDIERYLFALPARLGGLALPNPTTSASYTPHQYKSQPILSVVSCYSTWSIFFDQEQAKGILVHSLW